MEDEKREIEIRFGDLWTVLKSCWILVLAVAILAGGALYIYFKVTHVDQYQSTATIYVLKDASEGSGSQSNLQYNDINIANQLIIDCMVLLRSEDKILTPVLQSQNLDAFMTEQQLNKMITIKKNGDARVLEITVTSTSARRSAEIANAVAKQSMDYFNTLYKQDILSINDQAKESEIPSNPISMLFILLGGFGCAFVVYLVYLIRFLMDDKINSGEDVEKYLKLSTLGIIPNRHDVGRRSKKGYGYYQSYVAGQSGEERKQA